MGTALGRPAATQAQRQPQLSGWKEPTMDDDYDGAHREGTVAHLPLLILCNRFPLLCIIPPQLSKIIN